MEEDEEDWADGRKWRMRKNRQIVGSVGAWGRMEDSGKWRTMKKVGKMEEENER